jgi:hypothetical protein
VGHVLRSNCYLKHIIEGKIEGRVEVTGRRGRKPVQLLDDLKETKGCSVLKEETLDGTVWRTRLGERYGPGVKQTTE